MIGLQAYLSGQEFPGTNSHIDMEGGCLSSQTPWLWKASVEEDGLGSYQCPVPYRWAARLLSVFHYLIPYCCGLQHAAEFPWGTY